MRLEIGLPLCVSEMPHYVGYAPIIPCANAILAFPGAGPQSKRDFGLCAARRRTQKSKPGKSEPGSRRKSTTRRIGRKLLSGVALGHCKPESGGAGTDGAVCWREGSVYRMQNLRSRDGTFVVADDMAPADGVTVLNYEQALDAARAIAKTAGLGGGGRDPLLTVDQAVTAYADYLAEQGRCSKNVSRMRHHLPNELGNLLVAKLTKADFNEWNKRLAKSGMQRASINRTNTPLKAALNLRSCPTRGSERNPRMAALKRLRNVTKAARQRCYPRRRFYRDYYGGP